MKTLRIWVVGVAIVLALICSAEANTIVNLGLFTVSNQNPSTVLTAANADGVDSGVAPNDMDVISGGRITGASGGTLSNAFGTFTLTVNSTNNTGTLTFTMNSGFVLAGIGVHAGGGSTDRFFSVNDEISGTAEGPFFGSQNKKGMNQAFSNFDIFVERTASAPDGGMTLTLLGSALAGLGALRRFFMR